MRWYEVSNLGRIRSLDRVIEFEGRWGPTRRLQRGLILRLKPKDNGSGQTYWSFYAGKDQGYFQVNRCVCIAFNGLPPSSLHEAAHLDGDVDNNVDDNLTWATPIENARHKVGHGTHPIGSRNGAALLTEGDIEPILEAYCSGKKKSEIAARYDVTPETIGNVIRGSTWSHISVGRLRDRARRRARENLKNSWTAPGSIRRPEHRRSTIGGR